MNRKIRQHRGSLEESMKTAEEVCSLDQLQAVVERELDYCKDDLNQTGSWPPRIFFSHYTDSQDSRIGWDKTDLIVVEGFGVFGYIECICRLQE